MKLELYPWQKECLKAWFNNNCRGIVHVMTGAGKTVLAISAAKQLQSRLGGVLRIKIIVPQTVLTAQWASALQKFGGISRQEIGFYYGACKCSSSLPYMIYVINSARYTLSRHILEDLEQGCSVFLIADECHHYASEENRKIFDFIPHLSGRSGSLFTMGLSATPYTAGYEQYLVPSLGPEIYRYGLAEATGTALMVPYAIFNIALSFTPVENQRYQEITDKLIYAISSLNTRYPSICKLKGVRFYHALRRLSVQEASPETVKLAKNVLSLIHQRVSVLYCADARISAACSLIDTLPSDSRIILFGERIEQTDLVFNRLSGMFSGQVGRYYSLMDTDAKKSALDRYRSGQIRILVTCRALDEGFDIPSTSVGMVLSSSSVERQRIQRLGRILRKCGTGKIACLYYFYIQNTSERPEYMTVQAEYKAHFLTLAYDSQSGCFLHPLYEEASLAVLKTLQEQGKSQEALNEARRCLQLGLLRADWLRDPDELNSLKESAPDTRQQNYWICMRLIRQVCVDNGLFPT